VKLTHKLADCIYEIHSHSSFYYSKYLCACNTADFGRIVVRIGRRKFTGRAVVGYSGVEYEAVVYEFHAGILVSRSIEIVKEQW